jgi:para-aminobenzoate synthetase component 1
MRSIFFLQVHQMISTVTSKLDPQYSAIEAIKKSFPMGSMMDQNFGDENHRGIRRNKRGMYSGAVGYLPDGDFDFNVVTGSILYNQENKYISFLLVITSLSVPEKSMRNAY